MWSNPVVLDQYVDQELSRLLDQAPESVLPPLSDCVKRLFRGQITLDDAFRAFQPFPVAIPLLLQVQQMLEMSDSPLPGLGEPAAPGKPRRKSYPWTLAEDLRLLVAVARFGAKDWRWISSFLGAGRSSSQCNQRWCRALDPAISHRPWEEGEDQKLLRAVEVLGKASWCQIAKIMSGRTDLQCRYRYLQLAKVSETEKTAEPPAAPPNLDDISKKRRNSISIASFTNSVEIEKIVARPPSTIQLPHFLESSFRPREDQNPQYLHRLPPLLFPRCYRKPTATNEAAFGRGEVTRKEEDELKENNAQLKGNNAEG
jgi:hypothetical protein